MRRPAAAAALPLFAALFLILPSVARAGAWVIGMCLAFIADRSEQILLTTAVIGAFVVLIQLAVFLRVLWREWQRSRSLRELLAHLTVRPWPARLSSVAVQLGLSGRLDLIETREADAFCYGLIRPRVCITTGLVRRLNRGQLAAVLLHEREHLIRKDPLRLALAEGLKASLFYIRVVAVIAGRYAERRELRADDEAARQLGSPRPLAAALSRVLSAPTVQRSTSASVSGLSAAAERVDRLVLGRDKLDPLLDRREFGELLLSLAAVGLVLLGAAYSVTAVLASHLCSA